LTLAREQQPRPSLKKSPRFEGKPSHLYPEHQGRRSTRHISPHSLRHAAITNALDAGVPLRNAQILARHADPRTTQHYDRARGNLDRHGVHFLTAYVAGV
jgi:integrase